MALISIAEIAAMLAARIEDLCADLLPAGRREGGEWVEASRARGGLGDGLKVRLHGSRRGVWKHFGDGESGGDALDLVAYVLFGGDKGKAVAWAKNWLGLEAADPDAIRAQRQKAYAAARRRQEAEEQEREGRIKYARHVWLSARPSIEGTAVEFYLARRGIYLADLPKTPGSLRFAPSLKHAQGESWPAMVACIQNGREQIATHRTFLQVRGPRIVTKAPLGESAKMVLGPFAGGFITLNRGASGLPLKDAPAGDHVVLCEGIEDGLSIAVARPHLRVLAVVSVSNFKNICLPAAITTVTIAADNDAPGSPAARAVEEAVARFTAEGRQVFIARAPRGKDFNDCRVEDLGADVGR